MALFRHLLLLRSSSSPLRPLLSHLPSRHLAFSSAEEAAAERRRRKRRLRIEPPLHALRRDPNAPRPPRDPNAPPLPDSTSSLVGARLNLHNRVQSLIRSHDLDSASSTARHAVFSSIRPTVFTCNAVIAGMYRARRYDDASALFHFFFDQSNIVPNVVSYNFLIVSLCDSSRVDDALAVYRRILESAPFSPSHVTYRHLTRGLIAAGRLPDAVSMLREMITRGHGADSLVFNNVISGFLELDDLPRALELFDELRERCLVYDGTVTATFMDWYFRRDRPRDAMEAYQALLDKQFDMIPATCNALLEVLLRHGRRAEADRLFDGMLSRHAPPRVNAVNTDTYNVMVDDRFRNGDPHGAVEVFHRTGAKPLVMDVGCFNNIIGKLLENGLPGFALKLFEEMPEKSVHPDADTYNFFVEFYFKEGMTDEALQWFEKMASQEGDNAPKVWVGSYNTMYDGLAKAGRIDTAMEIFRKMWEKGLKPDSKSYEILITSLAKEALLDQVRTLVEEMVRIRVAHSPELRQLVLEAFDKEGRADEVEKMFTLPRPVVPPAPRYVPPRTTQTYNQNPYFGAYRPSYNAGNQFSHAGGPQPPQSAGDQFSHHVGPQPPHNAGNQLPQPPYNAGNQFSHAGGPQPPQIAGDQFSHHVGPQPPHNARNQLPQPPYNAGNQFSHAGGPQPPQSDGDQFSHHVGPQPPHNTGNQLPQPPYNAGNQFSHAGGPQPPYNAGTQFSQPCYNAGNGFSHAASPQPPYIVGNRLRQSLQGVYCPEGVNFTGPPQFSSSRGTQFSPMDPPKHGSDPQTLHSAVDSYQLQNDASAHSRPFKVQPHSLAHSQTSDAMPPETSLFTNSQFPGGRSHGAQMDSQTSYTRINQGWKGGPYQTNDSGQLGVACQSPPPFSGSQVPISSSYRAPDFKSPQTMLNVDTTSSAARLGVPSSVPQTWNDGNPQRIQLSAPQHSNVGDFQISSAPSYPPTQNELASHVASQADHLPSNSSALLSSRQVNPAGIKDNVSASYRSWTESSQGSDDDHEAAQIAGGTNRQL